MEEQATDAPARGELTRTGYTAFDPVGHLDEASADLVPEEMRGRLLLPDELRKLARTIAKRAGSETGCDHAEQNHPAR